MPASFMLSNDLLIVTGALVGSSGAIRSYIMCRAMNRKFLAGLWQQHVHGFRGRRGEVVATSVEEVAGILRDASEVIIVPGYGMAVAQAQGTISS